MLAASEDDIGRHYLLRYDNAGHLIAELDSSGASVEEHIWLNDTPLAMAQGTTLYYVEGTAIKISAEAGDIWRTTEEPILRLDGLSLACLGILLLPERRAAFS